MTETTPFEHKVSPRHTEFRTAAEITDVTIHDIYSALVADTARNELIAADLIRAVEARRSPLLLTGRTEHLQYFASKLNGVVRHVFVLKGGWERSSGAVSLKLSHLCRKMSQRVATIC